MDISNETGLLHRQYGHAHACKVMECELVDGNDVIEMATISKKLIMKMQERMNKPGYIEKQ